MEQAIQNSTEIRTAADKLTLIRAVVFETEKALAECQRSEKPEDLTLALLKEKLAYAVREAKRVEKKIIEERDLRLKKVTNYSELLAVALWEVEQFGFDTMVSFPIFTGGRSAVPFENIAHAETFMRHLSSLGFRVWSQVPYLDMNLRIDGKLMRDTDLKFTEFYEPLVCSKKFKQIVMLPGWERFRGCRVEHDRAVEVGANIIYASSDWELPLL